MEMQICKLYDHRRELTNVDTVHMSWREEQEAEHRHTQQKKTEAEQGRLENYSKRRGREVI